MVPVVHIPTSPVALGIAGLQCLNMMSCVNEMKAPAPYSKFALAGSPSGAQMVSSRTGMAIIYAPALAASLAALATSPSANGREALTACLLCVHFAKRCGEVACVHEYSGSVALALSCAIGTFYALVALLVAATQRGVPAGTYAPGAPRAALVAFAVGQLGNLWHHASLAAQRKGTSDYVIPTGGLFDACTMPHYLFEIVAWFGLAFVAGQLNAVLVAAGMASYLAGRSVATTRWYEDKFGTKWPKDRAHLVPGLF